MYIAHCTTKDKLRKIINNKVIKTAKELFFQGMGKSDIVYFSFYYKTIPSNQISEVNENCIIFTVCDIIKKYRYYYINSNYSYGRIYKGGRLSSRLYNMVQSSNNISDLKTKILNDEKMSVQCKKSLLDEEKIHDLFKFKNLSNPSLKDIYNTCGNLWEIGFFENIYFDDISYKIINNVNLDNLIKRC